MKTQTNTTDNQILSIDITDQPAGIYLLTITDGLYTQTIQIVKE